MNFLFLSTIVAVSVITAAQAPDEHSATGAMRHDQDFQLQGEYVGQRRGHFGLERSGLQVVALGNGQFSAREYARGLPGDGADLGRVTTYTGSRDNGAAILVADTGERIEVIGRTASSASARWTKVLRTSPTLGLQPPHNAKVIFRQDSSSQALDSAKLTEDGFLLAGATTTFPVGDFYMHVEFRTPYMPHERGQGRGNSGVYVQRRYEVQILDSFGLAGANNECAGLYKQRAPQQNMCFPPECWQTYDIYFTAARWNRNGRKSSSAVITVYHNGVAVHYRQPIADKTGAGQPEGPEPLPIYFQDHGNPVAFRNIWIAPNEQSRATTIAACQPVSRPVAIRRW